MQNIESDQAHGKSTPSYLQSSSQIEQVSITSFPNGASVRNKNFENIGVTPLKIDKNKYLNEEIKIIYGTKSRSIIVDEFSNEIIIDFDKIIVKPIIKKEEPTVIPIIEKPDNKSNPIIFLILAVILIIGFAAYVDNNKSYNDNSAISDSTAVESVDTTAVAIDTSSISAIDTTAFVDSDTVATIVDSQSVDTIAVSTGSSNMNNSDVASNLYRNYFVGKWSDENSTFVFYDDGDYFIKWDNGNSKWTKWEYYNGKLYFGTGYNNSMIRQYVLSYESNSFKYIEDGTETAYSAYRIGN